jgi:hypothetical protein
LVCSSLEVVFMMMVSFVVEAMVFYVVVSGLVIRRYFLFLSELFLSSSKVMELCLHLC